jgi:hypothetical protein
MPIYYLHIIIMLMATIVFKIAKNTPPHFGNNLCICATSFATNSFTYFQLANTKRDAVFLRLAKQID